MTSLTIKILRSLVPKAKKQYRRNIDKANYDQDVALAEDAFRNIDRAIASKNRKTLPMQKMEKVDTRIRTAFNRNYRAWLNSVWNRKNQQLRHSQLRKTLKLRPKLKKWRKETWRKHYNKQK